MTDQETRVVRVRVPTWDVVRIVWQVFFALILPGLLIWAVILFAAMGGKRL